MLALYGPVPSAEGAAREHSLASFRSSDTHLMALCMAQLPFRMRKVHSARPRSPAAGRSQVGKEQGIQLGKFATLRLKQN